MRSLGESCVGVSETDMAPPALVALILAIFLVVMAGSGRHKGGAQGAESVSDFSHGVGHDIDLPGVAL